MPWSVLDPQAMLVTDVFPCEDGHAPGRSPPGSVLETVRPRDAWVADRNFGTTDFLFFGIARRDGGFVTRRHGPPSSSSGWAGVIRAAGARPRRCPSRGYGSPTVTAGP